MLCLVPWGVEQCGDLDPIIQEAADPGLCLQTLKTKKLILIRIQFVFQIYDGI